MRAANASAFPAATASPAGVKPLALRRFSFAPAPAAKRMLEHCYCISCMSRTQGRSHACTASQQPSDAILHAPARARTTAPDPACLAGSSDAGASLGPPGSPTSSTLDPRPRAARWSGVQSCPSAASTQAPLLINNVTQAPCRPGCTQRRRVLATMASSNCRSPLLAL